MMQAVKGIYRNGKVELLEPPSGITEGEVIVTFVRLSEDETTSVQSVSATSDLSLDEGSSEMMRLGMFSGDHQVLSTEEDFKMAEFHSDDGDGLAWT